MGALRGCLAANPNFISNGRPLIYGSYSKIIFGFITIDDSISLYVIRLSATDILSLSDSEKLYISLSLYISKLIREYIGTLKFDCPVRVHANNI
tara:strand:- start:1605 stop:1886 length:282 start_codon:yes stop_codon:yes gene_type:complete